MNQTIQVMRPGGDGAPMQMLPPGRQAKTGTGSLRGRIVAIDTGAAVRRAQVRISGPDIGTKTALTDAQGRYEFRDLPAGRFNVSVSKSGFVTMQYGQNRPYEPGRPIELAEAQKMDKADVVAAARQRPRRPRRGRVRRSGRRGRSDRHAHAVRERQAPADARRAATARPTTSASSASTDWRPASTT